MKIYLRGAAAKAEAQSGGRARRGWRRTLAGAALAALTMLVAPVWAQAALPVCGTSISSCCKITTTGTYIVTNFTAKESSGACIRIKAPGVTLAGPGTIDGPGSGTMKGLVIASGANKANVEELTVSGFYVGIEVDANRAALRNDSAEADGTGIVINGKTAFCNGTFGISNAYNGMIINGPGLQAVLCGGTSNDRNGVVVNSTAVGAYALDTQAVNNGKAGLKINGVTGGMFSADSQVNGTYGIWLRGTRGLSLVGFNVYSNRIAGVYLGCHGDGPSNTACAPGIPQTNANILTNVASFADANGAYNGSVPVQKYGVVIDRGNHLNTVYGVNATGNVTDDGYDGNRNCDSNNWSTSDFNTFINTNRACVPTSTP